MTRLRSLGNHAAFALERNRGRLVIAVAILTALVLFNGARGLIAGVVGFIGILPLLAFQLMFAVVFIGAQMFMMFYWLSRPRKYVVTPDDPQIGMGFENYRGQPDLLEHARSTVGILQGAKEFELRGGEMPKGLLLSGRPGTGKTFLATCIASEAKLPFIYMDASSLQGAFIGTSQLMVVKLFRDARGLGRKFAEPGKRGACIVFLDELDSIGMSRGAQGGGLGLGMGGGMGGMMGGGSQGLNALLNQMDSLTEHVEDRLRFKILRWLGLVRGPVTKPLVFVIGATNRPEVLDQALTRPGRLDRMLEVYPPDVDGRRDIIGFYLSKKAHDPDIDMDLLVSDAMGWTPIMIKTVINEALIVAHDAGREFLTYKDWLNAADMRSLGLKQPIRSWNLQDRKETAYHEAGHAVAARYLRPEHRISKATIIRRGHALGFVQQRPREERTSLYARFIETGIMVSLAGHVIEQRFLGTLSTGPSSDLQNATNAAIDYVGSLAMGPTKVVLPPPMGGAPPIGPVLVAAHELLDQLYEETERLLRQKESVVHLLARELLEREELIGDELEEIFDEAERLDPSLLKPFDRKILQFRPFAPPPERTLNESWTPPVEAAPAASTPAASEGAASVEGVALAASVEGVALAAPAAGPAAREPVAAAPGSWTPGSLWQEPPRPPRAIRPDDVGI